MCGELKSVKRTTELKRHSGQCCQLFSTQPSVSRTLMFSVLNPSDESLGYCQASAAADSEHFFVKAGENKIKTFAHRPSCCEEHCQITFTFAEDAYNFDSSVASENFKPSPTGCIDLRTRSFHSLSAFFSITQPTTYCAARQPPEVAMLP